MTLIQYLIAALAAFAASAVNALAGGGTLITFPVLTALGVPPITANITSTVSLFPGYFGATWAQRNDLKDQLGRLKVFLPAALMGGLGGGVLLLFSGEKLFQQVVPFLILFATLLLALAEPLQKRLKKKASPETLAENKSKLAIAVLPVTLAAVYGGYFGAGMSVILLAVLSLFLSGSLTRLNALKQALAFAANLAAASLFLFSGRFSWLLVAVMALSASVGGIAGGKLAARVSSSSLRRIIVIIGSIVSVIFFFKIYF